MNKKAGFTLIELMIVVAIIAILAALAIPNLLRSRIQSNESATIGNMRTLLGAEVAYNSATNTYGTLTLMANAVPPYVDANWTSGSSRSGYTFTDAGITATAFTINADPVTFQRTGNRAFFTDESGVITGTDGSVAGPATAASTPVGG